MASKPTAELCDDYLRGTEFELYQPTVPADLSGGPHSSFAQPSRLKLRPRAPKRTAQKAGAGAVALAVVASAWMLFS